MSFEEIREERLLSEDSYWFGLLKLRATALYLYQTIMYKITNERKKACIPTIMEHGRDYCRCQLI